MNPSPSSTVLEIMWPNGEWMLLIFSTILLYSFSTYIFYIFSAYVFDHEIVSRNLGHKVCCFLPVSLTKLSSKISRCFIALRSLERHFSGLQGRALQGRVLHLPSSAVEPTYGVFSFNYRASIMGRILIAASHLSLFRGLMYLSYALQIQSQSMGQL